MVPRHRRLLPVLVIAILITASLPASLTAGAVEGADTRPTASIESGADWGYPAADADLTFAPDHSSVPESLDAGVGSTTVTGIVFLAGYSRYDGSDPLDHEVRREVHRAIIESPGAYVNELRDATDTPRSTLRYHLRILEWEGLVRSTTILGHLRYYPVGNDDDALAAALTSEATNRVLDGVARLEPVSVSALAVDMDRAPSTVSYHLDRLDDLGLVDRERDGQTVVTRLASEVRTALERLTGEPAVALE